MTRISPISDSRNITYGLVVVMAGGIALLLNFILIVATGSLGAAIHPLHGVSWLLLLIGIVALLGRMVGMPWRWRFGGVVLQLLVLIAGCILAGQFLDSSSDGQGHHQTIVLQMGDGLKAYQNSWYGGRYYSGTFHWWDNIVQRFTIGHATWAIIYKLTGQVEMAKGLIFYLAVLHLFLWRIALNSWLRRRWQCWLVAALATLNPVIVCQSLSFFVDAFVAVYSSAAVAVMLLALGEKKLMVTGLSQDGGAMRVRMALGIFPCVLMLLACSKRSGLLIVVFLLLAFLGAWWVICLKQFDWKKQLLGIGCGIVLFGMTVLAVEHTVTWARWITWGPYRAADIIDRVSKNGTIEGGGASLILQGKGKFEQLFISIFNKSRMHPDKVRWKWPFTVYDSEIREFQSVPAEMRIGGFGPWFGPVVLAALLAGAVLIFRVSPECTALLWVAFCLLTSAFLVSWWWPRWVPWLWLVPILILVAVLASPNGYTRNLLATYLGVVIFINVILVSVPYYRGAYFLRALMYEQLALWQSLPQPVPILFNKDRDQALVRRMGQWGIHTTILSGSHFDYLVRARLISSGLAIYSNDITDPNIQRLVTESKALQARLKEFHVNNVIIEVGDDVPEGMERHYPFGLKMKKP
jgi:hypothetical protein